MEYWKDIKGYEGLYRVSNYGRVKSIERWVYYADGRKYLYKSRIMKLRKNSNNDYLIVSLTIDGIHTKYLVHRLVAEAFIPNPHNYPQVNHKDCNPQNNKVENLEWVTAKYNCNYLFHNELNRLAQHNKTVLQFDKEGTFIKEWFGVRNIEKELGYGHTNISNCCSGKRKSAYGYIWKYKNE